METKLKKMFHDVANQYDFPEDVDIQNILSKKGRKTIKLKSWMLVPAAVCLALVVYSVFQFGTGNDLGANPSPAPATGSISPQTSADNSITPATPNTSTASMLDTFQWSGASYVKEFGRSIRDDQIGEKVGEVKFKVMGSGKDPSYILQDGDATMLDEGTEIFQVSDSENLAVKGQEVWVLYKKLK